MVSVDFRGILTDLGDHFSSTAIESLQSMFEIDCEIKQPWEVVEKMNGTFDNLLTLGSCNEKYNALTCIGIAYESLKNFLGIENADKEYVADILGEYANNYTAMLTDKDDFRKHFGVPIQTLPVLYVNGHSFLPFIWGIQGYVYKGDQFLYIGYSIRENEKK